jgi:predicted PurR-regulated permease PerM/methanogenic corrinoid protein MtbC1
LKAGDLAVARTSSTKDISRLLTLTTAAVIISALYFARVMFVPLALAILFTFVLTPVVSLLERIHFPRFIAVSLAVVVSVTGFGVIGWTVGNQLIDVTNQLPFYKSNIREKIDAIRAPGSHNLDKAANTMKEIGKEIADAPSAPDDGVESKSRGSLNSRSTTGQKTSPVQVLQPASNPLETLNSVVTPLGSIIIVIVLTVFMLAGREDLRNRLIGLVGDGHLNLMTQALDDAGSRVSRYLLLQLLINSCFGLVIGLGLYFIGLPNALLWGALAAALRFLPYLGSPMAAILPILLSLAIFSGWTRPLETIGLYAVVELLVANVFEPLIYGAQTGISSFAILFAAIFWTLIWGPIGLLLSTPLTVCLVVIGRHVPSLNFLNIMLGDQPVLSPEAHFYQRLLAADQLEAKQVLEDYLKTSTLEELYDSVVIPALALAEQDRHRDDLDDVTERFICHSTKELLEEIGEKSKEEGGDAEQVAEDSETLAPATLANGKAGLAFTVVCVPARDEADEIVGIMLAQLLERAGYQAQALAIGTTSEMLEEVKEAAPDIICISALPPFALLHARDLYKRLRVNNPKARVIIGLWKFGGDPLKAAARLNIGANDKFSASLAQTILQAGVLHDLALVPEHANADAVGSK